MSDPFHALVLQVQELKAEAKERDQLIVVLGKALAAMRQEHRRSVLASQRKDSDLEADAATTKRSLANIMRVLAMKVVGG